MERFFVDQRNPDTLISISTLKSEYGSLVTSGDLDPMETTFAMHLNNCMETDGGTLKEVFPDQANHTLDICYEDGCHRPCRICIYYPKFSIYKKDFILCVIDKAMERHRVESYEDVYDYEAVLLEDICKQIHGQWEYDVADITVTVKCEENR